MTTDDIVFMTICEYLAVACACATECGRTNLPSASSTQSSRPASWSPAGGFPRFQISRKLGIYNFANFDLAYLDDLWRRVRCPERAGDTRTTHAHARRSAYEPTCRYHPSTARSAPARLLEPGRRISVIPEWRYLE